jgi:hypothetical protein
MLNLNNLQLLYGERAVGRGKIRWKQKPPRFLFIFSRDYSTGLGLGLGLELRGLSKNMLLRAHHSLLHHSVGIQSSASDSRAASRRQDV